MEKGIRVIIEKDYVPMLKILVAEDIDINNLSGYVSEGVGKALKEHAVGLY